MEKVNGNIKLYAQIITFLLIWIAILYAAGVFTAFDFWSAAKKIPLAIAVYAIIGIIFTKYLWRLSILQGWLIKIPDLQGTWRGELKSEWVNADTELGTNPIPVILVIRQTFSDIKCTLMTAESISYSVTADIDKAYGGDDLYLSYNYTNRSKATIRDRSPIHDGAVMLKIIKKPHLLLEGEYWTSRKTIGEISLRFEAKKLAEQFS